MEKPPLLTKSTYFETTRQLLSNFGFLSPENRQSMVRLEESSKLVRNLKALDSINEYVYLLNSNLFFTIMIIIL